jgi:hypothetical protein
MRLFRAGVIAVVVAIAVALGPSSVLASSHVRTGLWAGKADCGTSLHSGYHRGGTVIFDRTGNDLTVDVSFRRGEPNTTYTVELWTSDFGCDHTWNLGTTNTDSRGNASATFVQDVTGYQQFFVYLYWDGYVDYRETVTVTVSST